MSKKYDEERWRFGGKMKDLDWRIEKSWIKFEKAVKVVNSG